MGSVSPGTGYQDMSEFVFTLVVAMVTDTDDEEEEGEDNEDSREVTAVSVPQQAPVRLQPAESAPGRWSTWTKSSK